MQNEVHGDSKLKEALGSGRPENVVVIGNGEYWVIEAKASVKDLVKALKEAKERARQINNVQGISCQIITGVAGDPDTTYYVETRCLVKEQWKPLSINNRQSTGFISPEQVKSVLLSGDARLDEYEIEDGLFIKKIKEINDILHNGAIHKRGRAEVLACLLLALANDQRILLSDDLATLINDINSRAESELKKYGKESFFNQVSINQPTSKDNHVKNKVALSRSIEILRGLNIASTINSGRDVLGQCYEKFLKYANDAKEIGIVLTPRNITNFGAEIIDVQKTDTVFDPTCGTGGFLVAALDKVRRDGGNIDNFKKGNLHGVEQHPVIATLAIVNMVFRGDGSSNIIQGNCLATKIQEKFTKVLMNPPFALDEYEWKFVDCALERMDEGGLLFAVLPTSTMNSSDDGREEITWREELLKRHTLVSVIKLPENLFYPQVSKGTYGVIIKAHCRHNVEKDKVVWAVLHDGVVRTKTQSSKQKNNTEDIITAIKHYISTKTEPKYIPKEISCSPITQDGNTDLSPENYIGKNRDSGSFDVASVIRSLEDGKRYAKNRSANPLFVEKCGVFDVLQFFDNLEKGKSGRKKYMEKGDIPLISTSEVNNGIHAMVNSVDCKKIYKAGAITISANGSSCVAHYHDYDFAANGDVHVGVLKEPFNKEFFCLFLCAAINNENWRFNYCNKLSSEKLKRLQVKVPILQDGQIDFERIEKMVFNT